MARDRAQEAVLAGLNVDGELAGVAGIDVVARRELRSAAKRVVALDDREVVRDLAGVVERDRVTRRDLDVAGVELELAHLDRRGATATAAGRCRGRRGRRRRGLLVVIAAAPDRESNQRNGRQNGKDPND